jgi:diguanylate cyclase (GGDEF)-like protein
MSRPGFRKGRSTGGPSAGGREGEGFLGSSLFSQAQIMHLMKNEFARSRRHGLPLGCLLLQVDRLPQLVDLHGAELRAAVRSAVAGLVRDKTRGSDLLGAITDDRYLVVLPHTDLQRTHVVAQRLFDLFRTVEVAVDGRPLALTLSVGVTACDDRKTMFFDSMLAQVEAAVEFATRNGGNQVASFGEAQLREAGPAPEGPAGRRASDRLEGGTP